MFNHNRGLWGYTGAARDGEPLTIQATGMGGPSAAIVVEELIDLGARTLRADRDLRRAARRLRSSASWSSRDGGDRGRRDERARSAPAARLAPDATLTDGAGRSGGARPVTVADDRPLLRPARGAPGGVAGRRRRRRSRWRRAALLAVADRRGVARGGACSASPTCWRAGERERMPTREASSRSGWRSAKPAGRRSAQPR